MVVEPGKAPAADPGGGAGPLSSLFGATVWTSFAYAPLALAIALASAGLTAVLGRLTAALPPAVSSAVWLCWLAFSHALFITFLCAFLGLGALPAGRRATAALRAAAPAALPMAVLVGLAGAAMLIDPIALPLLWLPLSYFAVPARILGALNGRTVGPSEVPAAHRLALLLPSFLFLLALGLLFRRGDWGMMDGGAILFPLLGLALFAACYLAAIFSCYFAWPPPSGDPRETASDAA